MLPLSQAVLAAFLTLLVVTGLRRAPTQPGRKVAHQSGFHWGEERFPVDFGFRFGDRSAAAPPAERPPAHPSGFRWKDAGRPHAR